MSRMTTHALLLDRDGTLVVDVPYNGTPELVRPFDGVRAALDAARAGGVLLAMVTNQSGVAHGFITMDDVRRVNDRIMELLGPFDAVLVCPHRDGDDCRCRKPAPGMLLDAARLLDVPTSQCTMIGDRVTDLQAASAAGMRGILVNNAISADAAEEQELQRPVAGGVSTAQAIMTALASALRPLPR